MKEIKIYSSAHCYKCMLAKRYLERRDIPFTNMDTEVEENLEFLRKNNALSLPVVVCGDVVAITPDNAKLDEIIELAKEA